MQYDLAIFDFDGTLANSLPWFLKVVNRTADRFGFRRVDEENLEALRALDARQIIRHLDMPMWKMPLVARHIRREMAHDIEQITLFPGVEGMLHDLSDRGVALAVVTSNSVENVHRVLGAEQAALVRYYGCGASLFGKRRKFRQVLRQSGITAERAICIGDELRDLHAANGAGIPFGAVAWGYTTQDALAALGPREIFTNVDKIVERIAGRGIIG